MKFELNTTEAVRILAALDHYSRHIDDNIGREINNAGRSAIVIAFEDIRDETKAIFDRLNGDLRNAERAV